MAGTNTRWLVTLCLLSAAQCLPSRVTSQSETDSEDSRRVLGSSVVTSVSVIMDHGNGTKTYFADGQSKNIHKPTDTIIGSPGNLLSPDRYEFYTFDETGDLVKRLMTLDEIHGLIAGADPESVMADASPTYYHDALSSHSSEALMHLPASDLESLDAPAVHKVLESVQNVLKNEMAANSGKPIPSMSSTSLHRPDSASAWSALFPGLIETPDDVAHLSGYLLPSKTTDSMDIPLTKKPLSPPKTPLVSTQPQSTTLKLPQSSIKTQVATTTEKVRSTPKYSTIKPELTTKFTPTQSPTQSTTQSTTQWTTLKPSTTKKPFRPIQSFEKQKPTLQKPILILHSTAKPSIMADSLEINKEMSASISDMLSQVTDSQSSNHKPLQTNDLVEKDSTSDYVPEESSPELSYYSPIAMSLSTGGALKPVTEALTSARKPPITMTYKTSTTEKPFSQKTTPTITATRFSPPKSNVTKPRPYANVTTASYMTKPSSINKFNATTVSTTRNNYQYPPSNMSTKYMQKITQTTQAYPNKLLDSFVKVVNKTINNATLSMKQPIDAFWNSTEETKNKFVKEPVKVFQTKVTSNRPNGINRTNVTLSNRIQELKTTAIPNFGYGLSTTTVRSQTEPDKYVSVKVEEWPMTVQHPTAYPSTTPYVSTEKSFFSSNNQPLNSVTDANVIRDLISSFMTKSSTASSVSTSTVSPTTVSAQQTLTASMSTTTPSVTNTITGIPVSMISSSSVGDLVTTTTTTITTTTPTTTTSTTTGTAAITTLETTTATGMEAVKTAVEAADKGVTVVTTTAASTSAASTSTASTSAASTSAASTSAASTSAASTSAASTSAASTSAASTSAASTSAASTSAASTSAASTSASSTTTVGTTAAQITTSTPLIQTTASAALGSIVSSTAARTTATNATLVTFTTPESETQYVPVTHFLPELQLKDRPETENNSTPGVDLMLKDGMNAVASMLQNTQKPAVATVLETEYQEIGERPYEKLSSAEGKQSSTEQASRKQATVKSDYDETTTFAVSENAATQDFYDFTTNAAELVTKFPEPNDTIAAESVTTNDTEEVLRNSEPGLEMLTVFNVSSTGQVAKLDDLSSETQVFFDATTPFENRGAVTNPATGNEESVTTTFTPYVAPVTREVTMSTVTMPSTSTTTTTLTPSVKAALATAATATATTVSTAATVTASAAVTSTTAESEVQNSMTAISENSTVAATNYTTWSTPATITLPPAVKSPGPSSNAYRPQMANSASPSTVELHPAPHESMGMEASVAFLGDDVRRFADLCNELSFKMWTAVTGKGQIASRSLVLSPFELTAMLAMVFLGARGSTSGQMNDVLRLDDMVTFNPHQVLRNITHSITNINNPGVATASFVREIYSHKGNGKILDFYKERVQQYYDGHVEEVDFNTIGDVLRRRTNLLVKRQTLGRVVEYLRGSGLSLTPPFAAFSANVFQTSCESASTEGRDGEMYFVVRPSTRQRRLVPVPAAVWRGGFLAGYEPGLDATAVCLGPDSAVSTILVLPGQQGQVAPGDGLARLEQRLIETSYRRGGWSRVLRSLLPRPGLELQVPRFSHRSVLNATAALQKMGLRDVFSDQKADLRGVNGLYDLYLSDMLQVNTFSTCGEDTIGARHHVETYPASPQRMGRAGRDGGRGSSQSSGADDDDDDDDSRGSVDESVRDSSLDGGRRKRNAYDLPLHSPYSHLPLNLRPRQARLPDVPRLRFDRPFLYLVRHNPTGMIIYLGRFNPRLLP